MRIYYSCGTYISYQRAGSAYMACLQRLGHVLTDDPIHCDLIILHNEPTVYADMVSPVPRNIPRVGYAVWESPQLPEAYKTALSAVDVVWTCSEFSRAAFAPFKPTYVLPHVVERQRVSSAALQRMAKRLGLGANNRPFLFYTIVDAINPRKNLADLLGAFSIAFPGRAHNVRLVVKQYRVAQDLSGLPFVIDLPETLDDEEMGALHALCNAYVSAHHAEAWGLPLSEAMSFGNPVIATGYSGNMEFMRSDNSFPLPYSIVPVSREMCQRLPLFCTDMTWADVDTSALVRALRHVRRLTWTADDRTHVSDSLQPFSPAAMESRLRQLLTMLPTGSR
ncbi:MAG: glycosyltransferase [Desulfovibrio sp.]|nr:glycosyltransferase [Desulfovibrio sp.]